jgi:hypothetical protein
MKRIQIIGLAVGLCAVCAALAVDLPLTRNSGKLVRIVSKGEVIAELKVFKPSTLNAEPGRIEHMKDPTFGEVDKLADGVKLEVTCAGKVIHLAADEMQVQVLKDAK